jgi:hypothetical protein
MAGEIGAEFHNATERAQPSPEAVPAGLEEVESHGVTAASAARLFALEPLVRLTCHWMSALKSQLAKRRAARWRRLRSRR